VESERDLGAGNDPFFDGCPLMALIAGPDGRIARANAALCEALGHAEAELAARTLPDLFEAPDRDGAEAMLAALSARGSEGSFTGRAPRKGGATGWLRLHARRAPDGVSVFALVMDITHWKQRDDERRRTEEALAQSQRELRAQLDLIESQRTAIRSMSMPIIEVSQGVLAMPVIGAMDGVRAAQAMEALLDAVVPCGRGSHRSRRGRRVDGRRGRQGRAGAGAGRGQGAGERHPAGGGRRDGVARDRPFAGRDRAEPPGGDLAVHARGGLRELGP